MAVQLSFLILTGLTGIHSITTVSEVSVKAGDLISIPCLYDSQYRDNVKYLCKGYYYNYCSYAIRTNQPNSEKFSISDDKTRRIFTVTMRNWTNQGSDYWCAVEVNGRPDVRKYFHLSVTGGSPSLYVDRQEITGFNGENITISCYHHNPGEMKWCRLGSSCVTGSSGSIDGTTVTINASISNVFTVTMSGLRTQSSGWYMCVKGDLQMPVHLTVSERPTTIADNLTASSPSPEAVKHSFGLASFIIPLSLLALALVVIMFTWFNLKRHNQTKKESSATTTAEEEVTYSDVQHVRKTSSKRSGLDIKSNVDIMYSSVITAQVPTVQMVDAENVTYSALVQAE
uniref:uncharacterized protein LOC124066453 n=1 Tax=Scatophagus argus TaxID=75038 RepID=UPI001ED85EEA|nr:uncharacterized protein LOC124066453 [Scatophagus argus]